ncbi:helix-turn-helix domain-containing protein [Roseateles cellulosilyticus]|uniref:AraC family transcriptional regulator n=1 Tax=Pelomonas cellulosilytica TaxID=2906762 RepID=A0ABS8XS70_9BURK|nr:AraC family transcriptional regulator [Pelomonas sp. P8]MCE4553529.1 AraC family transcriptional regulator [Pelomonas sp. P8]
MAARRDADALLVQEAVRYIRTNLAGLPPVPELARRLGLHEKRLLALFRDHLGQTVSGFVSEERVREGARLLTSTAMTVQEIAFAAGFNNPGNFAPRSDAVRRAATRDRAPLRRGTRVGASRPQRRPNCPERCITPTRWSPAACC